MFKKTIISSEKKAWVTFKKMILGFLENKKYPKNKELMKNMLDKFRELKCNIEFEGTFCTAILIIFLNAA